MVSTKKVAALTVSLVIVDCLLAGIAVAAVTGVEAMSETLAVMTTLVVVMATMNIALLKIGLKLFRQRERTKDDPLVELFAEQIEGDLDLKTLLTQISAKVSRHDKIGEEVESLRSALKPMLDEYFLAKAEREGENAGRP